MHLLIKASKKEEWNKVAYLLNSLLQSQSKILRCRLPCSSLNVLLDSSKFQNKTKTDTQT